MLNDKFPRVEQVILTQDIRGKGLEGDPYRKVLNVHALDGEFIAESDPSLDVTLGDLHDKEQKEREDERFKIQ